MKRFILFSFEYYEPCGGMNDLVSSFDKFDEARKSALTELKMTNSSLYVPQRAFHIYDTEKESIVYSGDTNNGSIRNPELVEYDSNNKVINGDELEKQIMGYYNKGEQ